MRTFPRRTVVLAVLAAATALGGAWPPGIACAQGRSVRIVFRGPVDPALAALVESELAASRYTPEVALEPDAAPASAAVMELEIDFREGEAYAIARLTPGLPNAAPIPIDDPEVAALVAVSLLLEAGRHSRAPPAPARPDGRPALAAEPGRALAAPAVPPSPDLDAAAPPAARRQEQQPPRRGVVFDLAATTAALLNGGSLGIGAFVGSEWVIELQGRVLHLWPWDRPLALASGSIAYVGRVADVDLEGGLEAGIVADRLGTAQVSIEPQLGGFCGLVVPIAPSAGVLVRLGLYAARLERAWLPIGLVSLGVRLAP